MGIIKPSNKDVLDLEGLHLYHSGVSNCSMRVRMTLAEKELSWESHHLNILAKEHVTPAYFGINPNGVVPTLVHDGKVIIESDDIIDYLDDQFPDPALKPTDPEDRINMFTWLRRATSIHITAVKTYIYHKRVGQKMKLSKAEDEKYRRLQSNPDLLEFHRKSTQEGFSNTEVENAKRILDACFNEMETLLVEQEWLAGAAFSLADIAWVPLQFTLEKLAGFDFQATPGIADWSERLSNRPSYQAGILNWWPEAFKMAGGKNA